MAARRNFAEFFQHILSLGFKPSAVIDVGAADGTPELYKAFPTVAHYAFEPLPAFAEKLRANLAHLNARVYQAGVMDVSGKASLFLHDDPYGSSLMNTRPPENCMLDVDITTLDIALVGESIGNEVLLKTDCQGADLMVIRGGQQTLRHCEVVIMECSLFPFWGEHEPVLHEIVAEMASLGFVVYDLLDGLQRPSDGALGQIDVVFSRKTGSLRSSNVW
jgi:FkbM family methyltransferase